MLAQQMLRCIEVIHEQGYVHRDVKPVCLFIYLFISFCFKKQTNMNEIEKKNNTKRIKNSINQFSLIFVSCY